MKKLLFIILPIIFFASCVTQKRCNEKYPPVTNIERIHDSIYIHDSVTTIVRDTVVTIKYGKDTTAKDTTIVNVINGLINSKQIKVHGELSEASSQVINGKLYLDLKEHAQELKISLKGAVVEKNAYKVLYEKYYREKEKTKIIVKNSKFANFCIWGFSIILTILIATGIYKIKKILP